MIVGTAGHIDHGKTTLVRALTGVDTDRLPEEKKRGISIELGYAFMDLPGSAERIGFIDVPGHERLVHTMLSGATGIDYALLLVAADDGVMPQTREHLAALCLLGLERGSIALTKIDRADDAQLERVKSEIDELVAGTFLQGQPVTPVSAYTSMGISDIANILLHNQKVSHDSIAAQAAFRLAVDRVFSLDGIGTVATGTVHAGSVRVGDELCLLPDDKATRVRVRSLHAQNMKLDQAHQGQRCALNLVGVSKDDMQRGQWLMQPHGAQPTDRIDVLLQLWKGETQPLRSGTKVHVHMGTAAVMGAVAVLANADASAAQDSIEPGQSAIVQIVLQTPIVAWQGDRLVLRDASASRTIAGGTLRDPHGLARYRRSAQRLAELKALSAPTPPQRLEALLQVAPYGVDIQRFAANQGVNADTLLDIQPFAHINSAQSAGWLLGYTQATQIKQDILSALQRFHDTRPDELGPEMSRAKRLAQPRLPEPLWATLIASLIDEGGVKQQHGMLHLPEHGIKLSSAEERISQSVAPLLLEAGFEGAWVRDLAQNTQQSEALMRTTLARLAKRGELHQAVKDLYYPEHTMQRLAAIARAIAVDQAGQVTAAQFRDKTGLGRKRAIQILEYFDRIGLLRRVGDTHRLRVDSQLFMDKA